jgi:FemAB-related protein (PEP-CTERM system-associated)
MLFGKSLVSLPFLDHGGICADDHATTVELYTQALRLSQEQGAVLLDLRHREASGLGLTPEESKVTFVLDLAREPDRAWSRLDPKVRNQVRKAHKSGLTVSWHGLEELDSFYDVFVENMRDLGSPVHSRKFFATILEEFPDSARLILVRDGSRTAGGGLCLSFKDTVMIPWASSRREYLSKCPNNLLYWEAIRLGCHEGFRRFDFGRSSRGSGTYHFKKQWGAVEQPLFWEVWRRNGHRSALVQSSDARYAVAGRAWKHLPVAITRLCGPMLRRRISN